MHGKRIQLNNLQVALMKKRSVGAKERRLNLVAAHMKRLKRILKSSIFAEFSCGYKTSVKHSPARHIIHETEKKGDVNIIPSWSTLVASLIRENQVRRPALFPLERRHRVRLLRSRSFGYGEQHGATQRRPNSRIISAYIIENDRR